MFRSKDLPDISLMVNKAENNQQCECDVDNSRKYYEWLMGETEEHYHTAYFRFLSKWNECEEKLPYLTN